MAKIMVDLGGGENGLYRKEAIEHEAARRNMSVAELVLYALGRIMQIP